MIAKGIMKAKNIGAVYEITTMTDMMLLIEFKAILNIRLIMESMTSTSLENLLRILPRSWKGSWNVGIGRKREYEWR